MVRRPSRMSLSAFQILIKSLVVVPYPRLLVLRQSHLLNAARLQSSLHERKLHCILLENFVKRPHRIVVLKTLVTTHVDDLAQRRSVALKRQKENRLPNAPILTVIEGTQATHNRIKERGARRKV